MKPDYDAAYEAFDVARSYDILSGSPEHGFNACVELCDRHPPGRTALRFVAADGTIETLDFAMLGDRSARFANWLRRQGVRPGDRVAGLLPRTPALLTVLLGTLRLGAVYQPLFTAFGPDGLASRLAASGARMVLTDRTQRPKLDGLDLTVVAVDELAFDDALDGCAPGFEPVMLPASAPFLMLFTSGTTGAPKGVEVPVHALRAIGSYMRHALDLRPEDRFWAMADPGWAYGLMVGVLGPLLMGQATTLSEAAFSVERSYAVIRWLGITNLAGIATAYRAMMASGLAPPCGVRALSSAGEPLDTATAAALGAAFGCDARDHFGQTEVSMVLCDHHGLEHARHPGAIGVALPGYRVTTLRADGSACSPGEVGQLAVDRRSPLFWFGGYHGRPAHEQPFVGDHYLTGDTATRAADGTFIFAGRDDDIITSSGYRIGPFEIEGALLTHPAVADAAAVGRPDAERTEIVVAFVVLRPGHDPGPELAAAIGAHVKTRLAAHAYPREVRFLDALPKNASGKTLRRELRAASRERGTGA